MSNAKLNNAKGLYLEGIRDGKVREAVTNYTGDRYTQHSTGVADGIEGFVTFFQPFVERNPDRDIRVVREICDGQFVFLHVFQDINKGQAKWVTGDFFDTDANDKIVEHWDVIQAFSQRNNGDVSMVNGNTEVTDLDKTDENKSLIKAFLENALIAGDQDADDFIAESGFVEHNPNSSDGVAWVEGDPKTYESVRLLIGQGNFVATLCETSRSGKGHATIDVFRLDQGRVTEHWDIEEEILPQDQWGNSGKF